MESNFGYIDPRPSQRRHDRAVERWEARRSIIMELYVNQGLTQEVVAEEIGVSQNALSRWLRKMGIAREKL